MAGSSGTMTVNAQRLIIVFLTVALMFTIIGRYRENGGIDMRREFASLPGASSNIQPESSQRYLRNQSKNSPNYAPHLKTYPNLCLKPKLFGKPHGGGWMICEDYLPSKSSLPPVGTEKCVVYSYGLGADWSFDNTAEAWGCEVHGFDPSGLLWRQGMHGHDYSNIDYAKQYPSKNKFFHNWGLGVVSKALYPVGTVPQEWPGLGDPQLSKSNSEPWELRSIEQTMRDLGHLSSSSSSTSSSTVSGGLTVLKVDTEGSEWDALTAFFGSEAIQSLVARGGIRQLLLEWHWDPDSRARNGRHDALMRRIENLGFIPWQVTRHEGSDCCLDVSYVWKKPEVSAQLA